jgi:hypothetical protein
MTNETNTNPTNETETTQYPLANDANGEPLVIPPEAVAWRIRKLSRKAGRPRVIFDAETGRPLELPLAVTIDDLADQVGESGRYRLEAIDAEGRSIPGCVAVTELWMEDEPQQVPAANPQADLRDLVAQLVESNALVMKAMASAFGQVHPAAVPQNDGATLNAGMQQLGGLLNMLVQAHAERKAAANGTNGANGQG